MLHNFTLSIQTAEHLSPKFSVSKTFYPELKLSLPKIFYP